MSKKIQKAGAGSQNIQGEKIEFNYGISLSDAKEAALDVFKANFPILREEALTIARERAETFVEEWLTEQQRKHAEGITQFNDPDFQFVLYEAQKHYARSGDEALSGVLIDFLIERSKYPSRSLIQIVVNQALEVAPKLTESQLAVLSCVFLVRNVGIGVSTHQKFAEMINKYFAPLIPLLETKSATYQHLVSVGCGSISVGSVGLNYYFENSFSGLFSRGFTREEYESKGLKTPINNPIICPCLLDNSKFQLSVQNQRLIDTEARKRGLSEDDIPTLQSLHNKSIIRGQELRTTLIEMCPILSGLYDVYDDSLIARMDLSSVGICIGHSNIARSSGSIAPLSTWID